MADTPFSYTGVQPGQAPMPDIMQDDLLLPQEIPEAYTPDPFDPFGKLNQAVVNQTPYEELLKRAKRRNPDALDVDFDGRQTEALGKEKGLPFDRDTVLGVEVYGEHVSNEKLAQMDGGKELLALAAQKRSGRRGFFEAIATGSGADFLPFVGDLASWGVSIKNMAEVRDTFRKMEAGQEVTLQEKVLAKLYEEDSLRGSTATWLGTAGSIIRTAPAFAAEFALTGGLFSAGKAGLTKVGLLAAKEAGEDMAVRTATMALKKATQEAARSSSAITAERLGVDTVLKNLVAETPGMAVHMPAMKAAAKTYVELAQNPRRIKAFTDGLIDYAKRGILDHGTDVVRDLPPGIQGKLIEAAGVAFIEAPIKGAMYAAFDQGVVNPIVAGVMGADEAVTKTELSITMAGAYGHDKELMDNAKMLAFGTAVAEYASESSGRAFSAVFGTITDVAGAAGRGIARRGIRAAAPEVAEGVTPYKQGSIARQLMDSMLGTEEQMKTQMRGIKRTAVEETLAAARSTDEAMRAGAEKLLGKEIMDQLPTMTADRLLAGQKDVVEQIVKDKMRFMDNSLIGYWVANKMLEKNFTPQKMTKWLETLGYDGIMGEYMEERYNGFAQGFFNLDGTPDKGFWDRIVKGTKQGFMPGWEQTAAEIFAFALPTVSRMAVAKSFQVIGAGPIGAMDTLAKSIGDVATRGVGVVIQGEDGLQKYVPGITTDADSEGVISQARRDFGKVNLDATKAQFQKTLDEMEEETVRGIPSLAKYVDKGETGFTGFLARSATALAAVLTGGNPIVGGFMASNPIKAAMIDRLGSREAAMLANSLLAAYKTASVRAQAEQAKASATAAEPQSGEEVATPTEATFSTAEKRAEAEFRIMSRSILRNYLQQHGTVMVDNKAKDSYVKNLFKTEAVEGKFAGLTETEFKKQFDEEILARAAQGDIKFDVIGGRARAVLVKKATGELSEMYKQAENFLGQIGVDSYLDLDGVEGSLSDRMKLFAGTPVDADLLRMAATDNGAEGDKAAQQMMMSGLVSSAHGLERGIDAAKEYARALLTANEGFFRPQYEDANKTRYEVRKTESGGYRIYNTSRSAAVENRPEFTSAAEAEAALATDGLQKRKASIYHTPTGTLITKHASMLLHPSMSSSEYLKSFKDRGAYADKNPVFKDGISTEQAQAELKEIMAMAERYANERHTISEADLEAHRVAFEQALGADGFETKAREYAETSGIRMVRSPVTRGELTYVVASAALNFGGEMYIPYKYAGSPTGVIEDSVESAVKGKTETMRVGDKTLEYGVFRDPANPEKWRPSILPLVNRIYSELTSMERRFENSTDPAEKRAAKEAKLMSGWFGQEYNSEGMSHMVSAFAFYRGLAAMGVGGTAQGGSAFYATLGRITEAVVTDHSYDALLSLVHRVNNRHVGGELTDASNLYAETLSGFIPPALMDYPIRNSLGIKTTVGRNAREAAARLANSINRAVEGRPPFTGVAEFANDEDSPEGRKARDLILAEMSRILARASMKGGNTRMGTSDSVLSYFPEDLIEIAEQAKANIIEAQRLEAAGVKIEATPEVQANVQAAAANSSDEVSGWVQGEPVVEVQSPIESIGPDGGPLGPNDEAKASFAEDAVNTSPAFAYDYAKRIAAANRQFMPSPDDDPMKLTADGAFDVWKKIDPLLEEKSREFFKAKMEKHVEKKKPQPAPVAFGEIFTEGVPEWMDVLTEDLTDDPETSGVSYSPDAIARALEKDMHARLFSGLSLRWFPQFRGDSSKVKTEIVLASRGVEGDSVGSLFDEAMWEADGGIHRAFENAETFEKFLSAANADAKSAWQPELKAFLLTLGYKSSFRLALRLKGAWMRDVISIKAGDGVVNIDTAKASLSAGADRRLRAGLYSKLSQMKDPAVYREKLTNLAKGDTLIHGLDEMSPKARVVELAKRLINRSNQLADAVDAAAGAGTDLAGALRDPMAAWITARETNNIWVTKAEADKNRYSRKLTPAEELARMYGQYEFGHRQRGGMLAKLITDMAEAYTEAYTKIRNNPKLRTDEKFLREATGRAAALLMRGSAIEAEAFAKGEAVSKAGDRGVISSFLNDYASRFGQPVVSRTGLSRNGDYGAAKVRALNPEMAAGQKAANLSEKRMAAMIRAGLDPKSSDPVVAAYAQRLMMLSMWPGYSMFASVSSLRRKDGSEVSEPTHDELERYLRESFDKGHDVARAAITTTDKTEGSFVIQWPRKALKELTGVDNPTYDQFYTAAAELVRADRVSTKRSAVFLSQGWGITKQNPRIGIDLTENLVGDSMIAGVYAKAAELDGSRENSKAHFTAVLPDGSVVFIKAKQRMQPADSRAGIKDAAQAMSDAMTEHKLDLYLDLDALKESEILAKDASERTAVALFAAGVMDAEVKLPQGGTAKVSDIATKYGLELQARKVGEKSAPLVIATIPGGLQMQYAANLTKSSKPSDIDLYTDFVRELVSPVTQSLQAQLAAAYLNRPGVKAATEAKAIESLRNADPWVAQLLDAGASVNDPDIYPDYRLKLSAAMKAEFNAFRALGSKYAESSNGRTVVKDADKDPMFTPDGRFFQVSDSYGAPGLVETGDTGHSPSALTHNAIALTTDEAKRKGRTHLPSAVQINNAAPGFRYAMRVRDGVGPMELRDRLSAVHSAMKQSITANDASIYLKAYADAENGLDGIFVNPDGSAAPAGALYNIGDLFDADGKLDLSAIYDGKDVKTDAKGEAYTLLRGELLAGSRTPLDNQSSWRLLSAAEPVSTVKADGSHTYRYRKVTQTADGFDAVMVPYPEGTLVPGPDAHIRMNEGDALLSGGDHDGDAGGLAQLRHDKYGRLITEVEGAAKAVAEGSDDAEAAKLFKAASEAVANAAVLEAIGKMANRSVAKDLARTGGARGHALFESDPIRSLTNTVERRAKSGVVESDLIEGGRIEHGALVKPNLADAKSAAKFTTAASDNANLGRSKAVDTAAQVLIAHNNGIRLKAFGESQQFLTPPATLSAEGRIRFAQVFGASPTKDASRGSAAWAEFRNFAARAKNVTFDDLKEGIMTWAEIYPAVIDLYVWMGYNSGASTRAQFDEFHMLWAEWMRSPEGRNILKAYANKLDPDAAGGPAFRAELDARVSILKGYDRGDQREKILMGLNPQSRDALASVMMARGLTGTEAIENLKPIASLFRGMTAMSNVKRVYDWKKLDAAYADKYESAARAVESVESLLLGKSGALTIVGEGREIEAAVLSAKAWVRTFAPIHEAGLYADKVRDAVVTAKFNRIEVRPMEMGGGVEVAVPDAADYDAAENASKTHLAWKAAVEITPAETQAKIRQLVGADTATGAPVRFVTAVEKVWQEMFRIWARQMKNEGGKANGAFEHLLPPSSENKLNRIALMGSIDASDAIAVVGSGLEALRNWKSEETWVRAVKQNVFEKGTAVTVEITPADAYWMLLQYATLTSGKGLDAGRAKQSLVPLFGAQVFAALGAGQVRMTQNVSRKDAFEAVTVAVYPKGSNRASKLTTAGGYDALRFATKEIERRARLGGQAEASPLAEPVVMKAEAVEQPKFDNIAPVAEVLAARESVLPVVKLGFSEYPPEGVISGMRRGGITMANAFPSDYGKPNSGWLGNPYKWSGNGGFGTVDQAIEKFRAAFLAKIEAESAFRESVLALRGKKLGYYRPQGEGQSGKHHLQVVQEWLASAVEQLKFDNTAPVAETVPVSDLERKITTIQYRMSDTERGPVLAFVKKHGTDEALRSDDTDIDNVVDPVSGIVEDDGFTAHPAEIKEYLDLPVSIRESMKALGEGREGKLLVEALVAAIENRPVSGFEKAREELLRGQMELPFVTRDAAGEALQTEASSALAHMKAMLMSSRAANAEDFRIPAMINGGVAATKPTDVDAASKAALAFERFANLPWMAKLTMAKAVSKAAAEATRELGFVDPSIPLALTLAVGRDAILNNDADARDMALGMMADAGRYDFAKKAFPEHVLSNERMKAMVAMKGAVREMTPRAVLSEYILAADPRKLSGVKGVDVERAVFGEISASWADETGNEATTMDYKVLAAYRKNPYLPQGMALALVEANDAYKAYLAKGGTPMQGPEYVEAVRVGNLALKAWDNGVKAEKQLMDRNGKERTDATSGLLPMSTNGYRQGEMKIDASASDEFLDQADKLNEAARIAQEEITRGLLNSDDRVKAYAGRMRSPHNAYWYEGTAPRHAEALFRMDPQAALSWTGKFMTTAFSDLIRQVEAIPGNASVIKRVTKRMEILRSRLTENNGGLPDPRIVRGDAYGKLMNALGLLQTGINADTRELADMARTLGTPEGEAMAEQADDVYYGTAVALRVARSVLSRREFGEAGVAAPENIAPKSGLVLETPVASIYEVALADVDTGMPDPSDDFNMAWLMTDYWLAATVLPSFQGVPLRDLLMDKEPLAVVPRFIAMSNAMEAMFGTDSDTGSLRKGEKVPGGGHHLKDGGYVYDRERTKTEVTRYGRRKAVKELADIVSGNAFSDSEYAMARWFTQAIYVWAGDGGSNGRQILGNTVDLYNLNWKDGLKDTLPKFNLGDGDKAIADGLRKLSQERRDHANGKRPYDLDMLVHALDNNLPEPLRDRALAELVKALNSASIANSGAQGALKLLDQSGFIVPRRRDKVDADGNPTGQQEIYDARFSIPVSVTADVFYNSTAQHKLILNGRKAEDLSLEKNGQAIRDEFSLARKSFRTLSWFTDGDGRMFTGGAAAPLSRGSGFFQYHARKRLAEVTPDYRAKVNEAYASLKDALDACLDRKAMQQKKDEQFRAGVPVEEISAESEWLRVDQAAGNSRYARMFTLFRDLSEGFEGTESPLTVAQMITSDKRYAHHGDGFGTGRLEMRSLAKAIYSMTVRKLHESAWDAGLAKPLSAEEAGMEAFNAAMEDSAAERSADLGRVGATFAEIYDLTGALPANLTAGEALAKFATETATALRYRGSLNQAMLSVDEYGMPLVYMEPGDGADDTIPDTVWQAAARMWVRAAGRAGDSKVTYDESKTGKENAKLLYPVMVDGKVGAGASRSASGGLDRYVMTDVKVPAGISAVKRAAAMKNPRGDDTYAAMDIFAGGEAAGQLEQLFAISGFTRTDMMLPQINRVLSWSKSLSVMNSFFFPIATAFESPIAAVGLWPTLFGLTSKGSDFFRKASEGGGALDKVLKAGGVDFDAPGMKDILKMIGTDDPALVEMKTHAILAGLSLADRSRNVSDHDRTALAKDVKNITAMVRKEWGGKSASAVKAMMEGLLEHSSEFAFEYVINATKIAVFAQMNNRLRAKALAAGRWWDPVLSMRKWAGYINAEVGGIDPATVAAMTPRMQNWLKGIMFSWEWTLGAWLAGGGGVITQKMFGMTSNPQDRGFMFGRWARMYFTVMVGLPAALQIIATGIAKAAGDDDDDDRWFTWQNEKDRAVKSFDITPLLRHIGKSAPLYLPGLPTWGELKNKLPADVGGILPVGAFIPALTGDEGDMVSSRKRRYYMRFGKQGWEVAAWFENPMSSFLGKMSMPLQRALEGVLGVTPSTGWETPFKELGFWERWLSLDGEKSATLNMLGSFMPFSYASMTRAPEAGALSMFGPVGKGMSKTRAEKEMQSLFENWADADSYAAIVKGNKGAWTDLKAMSVEYLDALRMNGYDPEVSLKQAVAAARKPLYDAVHSALPRVDGGAADIAALERAARGLNRLDYIHRDLLKSLKSKDKLQNIKRSKELKDISNAAIRESFSDPYGRGEVDARKSQSADLGGDVTAFLATDEIPKTVLGYQVVPIAEISPEDLNFFSKNPSAAGFFKKGNQ